MTASTDVGGLEAVSTVDRVPSLTGVRALAAMLVVGTSGLVTPAAGLPAAAKRAGATVVVVNPNESELDDVADHLIRGPAAAVLPSLFPS